MIVNSLLCWKNTTTFVTVSNSDLKISFDSYVTILDGKMIKVGNEIEVGFEFCARRGSSAVYITS